MPSRSNGSGILRRPGLALAAVFLLSCVILLPSITYFFQGDSLYWLAHRYQSWSEVARALVSLDLHGWYRPLSHRLIPSLFFPLFGLNALPYHIPVFFLFFLICLFAHRLYLEITGSHLSALLGVAFLALHSSQVFVTFDFFAEPDLLVTLFGLLTIVAAIPVIQRQDPALASPLAEPARPLWSALWFLLALLSKETATLLPLILLWGWLALDHGKRMRGRCRPDRVLDSFPWTPILHAALLGGYILFVFAGLRGASLESGTVSLAISQDALVKNLLRIFSWSFNLPWGPHSRARSLPDAAWAGLILIALLCVLQWIRILLRGGEGRRYLIFALGWFGIAGLPLLVLVDLKPYYLLFPLTGFSLAAGLAFSGLVEKLEARNLGKVFLVGLLGFQFLSSAILCDQDRRNHPLLGGSSLLNQRAREDVTAALPKVTANSQLVILDPPGSIFYWSFAQGELFRLLYSEPGLEVSFTSLGFQVPGSASEESDLHVFQTASGHLLEVTNEFLARPSDFLTSQEDFLYEAREVFLQVTPTRVEAGWGSYRLELPGFENQTVEIQFRRDREPIGVIQAQLDSSGAVSYFVSRETPPGRYQFLAVRKLGEERWYKTEGTTLVVE